MAWTNTYRYCGSKRVIVNKSWSCLIWAYFVLCYIHVHVLMYAWVEPINISTLVVKGFVDESLASTETCPNTKFCV